MKLKKNLYLILPILLAMAQPAVAGEFSVRCAYVNQNLDNCASSIKDIVTDKFTEKYRSDKYQIFVHSYVTGYSNGGFTSYAVTGVVLKGSNDFPLRRFSS